MLGLSQKKMAHIAECSWPTIQAIERQKLKLSDELGMRIAFKTGVDLKWLTENQLRRAPTTLDGRPYTLSEFDRVQTQVVLPPATEAQAEALLQDVRRFFAFNVRMLALLYAYAHKHDKFPMCAFKVSRELQKLIREQVSPREEANAMIDSAIVRYGEDCEGLIAKATKEFFAKTQEQARRTRGSTKSSHGAQNQSRLSP